MGDLADKGNDTARDVRLVLGTWTNEDDLLLTFVDISGAKRIGGGLPVLRVLFDILVLVLRRTPPIAFPGGFSSVPSDFCKLDLLIRM